MIFSAVY